jgi:hypothetical protein
LLFYFKREDMHKLDLKWIKHLSIILLFSLVKTISSLGCSTPVFRYALEMWPAFNFTIEVVHNGELTEQQALALKQLSNSSEGNQTANLLIKESADFEKYNLPQNSSPQILLYHPVEQRDKSIIWQGELSLANVNKIIDSPARQEILRNIQKGDAVTWVLVNGKDEEKNKVAYNTLNKELKDLSETLKLASDATNVDGELLDINIINQGVKFSMLTVSRDDLAEEIFIKMLLSTEPDLPFIKAPMAFPVFGRGRVLFALVGKGIKRKLIEETCNSVIGWCSCTIKEDNPGSDLLFKADWEAVVGDSTWIKEVELPEITGMSGFIQEPQLKVEKKEPRSTVQTQENKPVEVEKIIAKEEAKISETTVVEPTKTVELVAEKKQVSVAADTQMGGMSPLTRNIIIVVVLLLITLPTVSFFLRKNKS